MRRDFEIEVVWWPFELHPETPKQGRDLATLIRREGRGSGFREYLQQTASEAGLTMVDRTFISNSHLALEAGEFARAHDRFEEVHEGLFRAYFSEGKDIGDLDVLAGVAADAGLDVDDFRYSLETGRYREIVDEATRVARANGFHSTPSFIMDDRYVVQGAQEYLVFEDLLTRFNVPRRAQPNGERSVED